MSDNALNHGPTSPTSTTTKSWRSALHLVLGSLIGSEKRSETTSPISSTIPATAWRNIGPIEMTADEWHLSQMGYRQTLKRTLGSFDTFLLLFATLNFTSGLPALFFAFAIFSGGPQVTLINWILVGTFSMVVALALAEISASMPTAGGIYYFSYRLGGKTHGKFLAWLTAWLNWGGWIIAVPALCQVSARFLMSMIRMSYPSLTVLDQAWFEWIIMTATLLTVVLIPNIVSPYALRWTLRTAMLSHIVLLAVYFIWIPVQVSKHGHYHPEMLHTFINGINPENSGTKVVNDAYCWVVGILSASWIFFGYDICVHTSEETKGAARSVAKGMCYGTMATFLISIPVVIIFLICIQDLSKIAKYGFPEYLMQTIGRKGSLAVLVFCYIDTALATSIYFVSAQRVTYAIARDDILPGSKWIKKIAKNQMPINAAFLVVTLSIAISAMSIGSAVALPAITAGATVSINLSYFVVIFSRHILGAKDFVHASWHLGFMAFPIGVVALIWMGYVFLILIMPFTFPVTWQTLNYAPLIMTIILSLTLGSWVIPKWGGRIHFKGPNQTISKEEIRQIRVLPPVVKSRTLLCC